MKPERNPKWNSKWHPKETLNETLYETLNETLQKSSETLKKPQRNAHERLEILIRNPDKKPLKETLK